MKNQPQDKLNDRQIETNALESKTACATSLTVKLQPENVQLQEQVTQLDRPSSDCSAITEIETVHYPQQTTAIVHVKSPEVIPEKPSKFKLKAIAVAGILLIIGSVINHRQYSLKKSALNDLEAKKSALNDLETIDRVQPSQPKFLYNVTTTANLNRSQKLQQIVGRAVKTVAAKGLSTQDLSISLIDLTAQTSAGYQQDRLRYPASVIKLFWMVAAYGHIDRQNISPSDYLNSDIARMIQESDNDSASRVLDAITGAKSGSNLNQTNLQAWLNKRQKINNYFRSAGYENININQKAYPINYLQLEEPQGRELQMRGEASNPVRNQISTAQTARLIAEIISDRAISPEYSQKMRSLMNLDQQTRQETLNTANSPQFNPVLGFFSQSLPQDINIFHKAGWTSRERNEAAYITSKDGKVAYILVVFGENSDYAQDWDIFPQLSAQIYQQLSRTD